MHFLPFNPVDKRTAITYIDSDGNWYRASKGAPEQVSILAKIIYSVLSDCLAFDIINLYIHTFSLKKQILNLCKEKKEIAVKVHTIIDKFAERGLRSLAVAIQVEHLWHLTFLFPFSFFTLN